MSVQKYKDVVYYVGIESEHTKAFGSKTFYVIGVRNPVQVITKANENKCKHIRIGAQGTFQKNKRLLELISACMTEGFMLTAEVGIENYGWAMENIPRDTLNDNKFIMVVSVPLPNLTGIHPNLIIKVDDPDMSSSNQGTWTYPATELMDSNRFTRWDDHDSEVIVWTEANQRKLINDRKNANRK